MVPWAIGTNTGRSVRIPAAWNGVTGLKTTIGRISTFGVLPLGPTRPARSRATSRDAALLLAVLQGEDRRDRRTLGVHDVDPMPELRRDVKGTAARTAAQ
jgi:aspartyl-tRNA(Asn)/glutamyl-tRNA(Gln) amidotransferase subunit A